MLTGLVVLAFQCMAVRYAAGAAGDPVLEGKPVAGTITSDSGGYTLTSAGAEAKALTVTDGDLIVESGSIGLGPVDPGTNKLQVSDENADVTIKIKPISSGYHGILNFGRYNDDYNVLQLNSLNNAFGGTFMPTIQGLGLNIKSISDPIAIGVGTEAMRIDSSNNVGIGTIDGFGGGEGVLAIGACATEPYSATAGAGTFFYTGNEMWVANEALTKTQLTTHPEDGYSADANLPVYHGFRSKLPLLGKEVVGDLTATVAAVERLMKAVFGEDVSYQKFRDLPATERVTQSEWRAAIRRGIREKLKEEMTESVEIPLSEAVMTVDEDVVEKDQDGTPIVESTKKTYKFVNGEVVEKETPIYKTKKVSGKSVYKTKKVSGKSVLKPGVSLDKKTGKLYIEQPPDEQALEAAVDSRMEGIRLPIYITDKLGAQK